jgi:hypothetical protein
LSKRKWAPALARSSHSFSLVGHRYDPLQGRLSEDELLSSATHLLHKPDEGDGAIFTQRATVMLTQLFLAARNEGVSPMPFVRSLIRAGLPAAAANLSDRFLLSSWGTWRTSTSIEKKYSVAAWARAPFSARMGKPAGSSAVSG